MTVCLQDLQIAICGIKQFIEKYSALGDAHMVDYFVCDHWNSLLSYELRNLLLSLSIEELHSLPKMLHDTNFELMKHRFMSLSSNTLRLSSFLKESKDCLEIFSKVLTNCAEVKATLKTVQDFIGNARSIGSEMSIKCKEYMCRKKSHEVAAMSPLVHHLCQHCQTDSVLDIGSGKGYLSTFLTLRYNLCVTGVEANESNSLGANVRAQKYLKYWLKHSDNQNFKQNKNMIEEKASKFNSVVTHLSHDTDLTELTEKKKYVVSGLHACGDLCSNIISSFLANTDSLGLCVVGCCYHHCTESDLDETKHLQGFPLSSFLKEDKMKLGRNKRMVASQAPEKAANGGIIGFTKSERSLFYRAVLNVILKEEFSLDVESHEYRVGKIFSKSKNFVDYVRKCLKKLNIDDKKLTDEIIQTYVTNYEARFKEMIAFTVIRQLYAPAIEALIVLDRFCYLLESPVADISHCFVSEIFDPVLSPRRYAIIAVKNLSAK